MWASNLFVTTASIVMLTFRSDFHGTHTAHCCRVVTEAGGRKQLSIGSGLAKELGLGALIQGEILLMRGEISGSEGNAAELLPQGISARKILVSEFCRSSTLSDSRQEGTTSKVK